MWNFSAISESGEVYERPASLAISSSFAGIAFVNGPATSSPKIAQSFRTGAEWLPASAFRVSASSFPVTASPLPPERRGLRPGNFRRPGCRSRRARNGPDQTELRPWR